MTKKKKKKPKKKKKTRHWTALNSSTIKRYTTLFF